ncbi:MAG: hypothetical protein HKN17_01310 [Rhodothermales bacterium]|nr:hypothetical protein [Rhodothermales bacterium]
MSDLSSSDFQDPRSAPTVTRDKWIAHACNKMSKGYTLIVSPTKRNATFFMRGKGYDPCPYVTAKRLLEMNMVEETGTHSLGTVYKLIDGVLATPPQKSPAPAAVVDEDDDGEPADESLLEALESLEDTEVVEDDEDDGDDEKEEEAEDEDRP